MNVLPLTRQRIVTEQRGRGRKAAVFIILPQAGLYVDNGLLKKEAVVQNGGMALYPLLFNIMGINRVFNDAQSIFVEPHRKIIFAIPDRHNAREQTLIINGHTLIPHGTGVPNNIVEAVHVNDRGMEQLNQAVQKLLFLHLPILRCRHLNVFFTFQMLTIRIQKPCDTAGEKSALTVILKIFRVLTKRLKRYNTAHNLVGSGRFSRRRNKNIIFCQVGEVLPVRIGSCLLQLLQESRFLFRVAGPVQLFPQRRYIHHRGRTHAVPVELLSGMGKR